MVEINSITDFLYLDRDQKSSILKGLRTADRLDHWLEGDYEDRVDYPLAPRPALWSKLENQEEDEERNNSDIHPSQLPGCLLKIWYDCNGLSKNRVQRITPRLRRIFDLGSAWHDWVQTKYGKKGAWGHPDNYYKEIKIDPDAGLLPRAEYTWIRGHVDAVLVPYVIYGVPGLGDVAIRVVHEYKTINSNGYSNLKKPKSDHEWQATAYAYVLDVPIVVYLYLNKDTQYQADYPIAFDQQLWTTIENKIEKVQHYTNISTRPPWEETSAVLNPRECSSCDYLNFCKPPKI